MMGADKGLRDNVWLLRDFVIRLPAEVPMPQVILPSPKLVLLISRF